MAKVQHQPHTRRGQEPAHNSLHSVHGFGTDKGREMVKVSNGKALVANVLGLPGNKLHLSGTSKLNLASKRGSAPSS